MNFKTIYPALLLLLFSLSCRKEKNNAIDNLNDGKISIYGHAGAGFVSPTNPVRENTLASIKKAIELYGADGVEVDVQMSHDGVFYLYHDGSLNNNTNFQGRINEYSSAELQDCKYNNSNENLTTLEACLQFCSSKNVKPKIWLDTYLDAWDDKSFSYTSFCNDFVIHLDSLLKKYDAQDWVDVESTDISFLDLVKSVDGGLSLFIDGPITSYMDIAVSHGLKGIVASCTYTRKEEVESAHEKGIFIVLFDVRQRLEANDAIKLCPDAVQTDDILLMKQLLDQ